MKMSTSLVAYTKAVRTKASFTWIIEDFSAKCPVDCDTMAMLESPLIEVKQPCGTITKWSLTLAVEEKHLQAYLYLKKCSKAENFKDGMCDPCGNWAEQFQHVFSKTSTSWGRAKCVSVEELYKGQIENGKLRVFVTLEVFGDSTVTFSVTPGLDGAEEDSGLVGSAKRRRVDQSVSFEKLLLDPSYSDLTLRCGSDSFKVHKAVLSARSSVFATMLAAKMKEAKSSLVEVTDLEPRVLKVILEYIYSGQVDIPQAEDLLAVIHGAEKYDLKSLKDFCFRHLVQCLSDEDIGAVAVAAYLYGAEEGIRDAIRTYMEPKFFGLMKNPDFRKLVEQHSDAFF